MLFFPQNILDRLWPSVAFQTLSGKTVCSKLNLAPALGSTPLNSSHLYEASSPGGASGEKQENDAYLYDPGLSLSVRG